MNESIRDIIKLGGSTIERRDMQKKQEEKNGR